MSGRLEQLARQIRRLRTGTSESGRTLQRAIHLALDLAAEHCNDGEGDFAQLATKGVIDSELATRLATLAGKRLGDRDVTDVALVDLDVFLRSIELGHPAAPLPVPPLGSTPKLPPGTQRASVNVSGRVLSIVGQSGRAFALLDDRPVGQPFDLISIPMSAPNLDRAKDGSVKIAWPGGPTLELAADFASVRVSRG